MKISTTLMIMLLILLGFIIPCTLVLLFPLSIPLSVLAGAVLGIPFFLMAVAFHDE